MKLPNGFKSTIADVFYDKQITVYTVSSQKDSFGQLIRTGSSSPITFSGNVRFTNLRQIQEDYGIKENIDIAITTDESVDNGKIIGYEGQTYQIVSVIPSDSHNLIVAKKWSSKSTTLTSA